MSALIEYTDPVWRNLNLRDLKVDEAYLILRSAYEEIIYLYTLSNECYKCPFTKAKVITFLEDYTSPHDIDDDSILKINIAHGMRFRLYNRDLGHYAFDNETAICEFYENEMREFGVYNLTINAKGVCDFAIDKEGVNSYLSILTVFLVLVGIILSIKSIRWAWQYYRNYQQNEEPLEVTTNASPSSSTTTIRESKTPTNQKATNKKKRLRSLDAFRGLSIVLMIFVNSGGGDYWWIEHAPWNGLHLADLVFPSFLWIMGVCIPTSVRSQLNRGATKWQICRRILWRSFKLFGIGVCLNSINGPQMENLRIMGVLQRFGIAYLVCGCTHTLFAKKDLTLPQAPWKRHLYDLYLFKKEYAVVLILIILHLGIVLGLNVPNCPKGYLGPGGKHDFAQHPNCIGGAIGYIDLVILGTAHVYNHPTARYIYDSGPFDPEGIFGCVLTCVQVFYGILAGVIIAVHTSWKARMTRWLTWSVVLGLLGGILCSFSKESGPLPINKNLWSLSFVFVTTSLAFLLLSILYFIVDVKEYWHGSPFVESGMNSIIMYVGHSIMHKMLPWHWRIGSMNTHFVLLLEATWNTLLWVGIALYLDYKKFYYSL